MIVDRDYEQEASAEGWKPDKEDMADPSRWVDAKTFVERGEKISGILKSKVDRQGHEIEKLKRANQKFGEYHRKTIDRERKEAEGKIMHLETMLAEAVDAGDGQTFTKVNRQIDNLKANMPQEVPDEPYSMDPVEGQWLTENPWYNSDPALRAQADGISDVVSGEGYQGKARLDEITRRVKETFPDKFGNPNRGKEDKTGGGSPVADAPKEKTYKSMDKEAKDACDSFVAEGFITKEEYVKQYFSEEE